MLERVSPARRAALGRYIEPAMWVLIALDQDPLGLTALLDTVRSLDGPIGPGTLVATVSRLERLRLVESTVHDGRRPMYRLTILGAIARRSCAVLQGPTGHRGGNPE
jgi:DNA-binding PadR family transcriptional regulator